MCPEKVQAECDNRSFLVDELYSSECQCGRWKNSGKSFCHLCYKTLPWDMQRDLYRRVGDGYEEAYKTAVRFLN
jgi:hypothetical protein